MPIVKASSKLIFYAHVPKCGGSSVERYLEARFGAVGFEDPRHSMEPAPQPWSKTSPQHVDKFALRRLFPVSFFDAYFTIVRHPMSRIVSAFHFQQEVESKVSGNVAFSDWLAELEDQMAEDNYIFDNHVRPMNDMVPDGAKVFHLEHGLDALVPYLDDIAGNKDGPRAVGHTNKRGAYRKSGSDKVVPSSADEKIVSRLYAEDFHRFGYVMGNKKPLADPPFLPPEYIAARDAQPANNGDRLERVKTVLKRFM